MADDAVQSLAKKSQSEMKTERGNELDIVSAAEEAVLVNEGESAATENSLSSLDEPRRSLKEEFGKIIEEKNTVAQSASRNRSIDNKFEENSSTQRINRKKTSKLDVPRPAFRTSKSSTMRQSISSRESSTSDAKNARENSKAENTLKKAEKERSYARKPSVDKTSDKSTSSISVRLIRESKSRELLPESKRSSLKCFERPESPPNPYNRFKYPKMLPQWPLPDQEEPRVGVANSVNSLECGFFPKSPLDHCSCCPSDKDPLNCCAKMVRTEEGCCVSEWIRKEFYYKTKSKVEKAIMRHKIFLVRGELPKLQEALAERGWVQKYESTKTRTVPYGSVASLETNSLGDLRQPDGTLNENALIFRLLRHRMPDFIWDCRNNFIDWNCTLRNDTLLNRFQKSFIYTSKASLLGMAHILQSARWFYEDNVASVKYPRSYNLTRDAEAYVDDYRRTAAAGLLRWFVESIRDGKEILSQGNAPISIAAVDFAVDKIRDFIVSENNENLDFEREIIPASSREWDKFLNDCEKVLHGGNGLEIPSSNSAKRILQEYYVKALAVLNELKEIDPQYGINGSRNIWILKPSELCCGTGINISHNLKEIFQKVKGKPKDYYTVQKYIEHPLLIHQTKFDIRQWYLVTNTFPLTIWMFKEALLRFSSKPYTFGNYHESIHICNTAVQEKYKGGKKRRGRIEESKDLESSVRDENWDCDKLNDYLKNVGYEGKPYHDEIFPKMTEAIILTMLASQEYMDKRKCSFELYGADFMVAEDLSVWLIEINTNPRMHPPGLKMTERLYPAVLESLVKVVFDLPMNPSADTGGFVLAYKQNISEFQPYLGSCMFVFGKAMNLHDTPSKQGKTEEERKARGKICNPWRKQHRAWTAPPAMPRARDPGVVDLIDFLKSTRGTIR